MPENVLRQIENVYIFKFVSFILTPFTFFTWWSVSIYSFEIIPKLGEIVLSSEESYHYLAESIRMHPNQEELKDLFEECGFENCNYENLTNGIVAIHTGTKPKE